MSTLTLSFEMQSMQERRSKEAESVSFSIGSGAASPLAYIVHVNPMPSTLFPHTWSLSLFNLLSPPLSWEHPSRRSPCSLHHHHVLLPAFYTPPSSLLRFVVVVGLQADLFLPQALPSLFLWRRTGEGPLLSPKSPFASYIMREEGGVEGGERTISPRRIIIVIAEGLLVGRGGGISGRVAVSLPRPVVLSHRPLSSLCSV